jgi:hypothetical protein
MHAEEETLKSQISIKTVTGPPKPQGSPPKKKKNFKKI